MACKMNRRSFLNKSIVAGAAAVGIHSLEEKILLAAMEKGIDIDKEKQKDKSGGKLPMGKLGKLEISRLIGGGNLISGWCHERDFIYVSDLAQAYLTEEKKFDTLELMEERGINAIVIDMIQLDITNEYRRVRGGKIKTICAIREDDWDAWENPNWKKLRTEIDKTIDNGCDTMFTHGGYSDGLVGWGKRNHVELLGKAIEHIKKQGFPAGLGCHDINVIIECDKLGIQPDYYFKTFHHDKYWSAHPRDKRKKFSVDSTLYLDHDKFHDNIFELFPEKTIEVMARKKQPWIAYKTLAAGSIQPKSAFKYCFENGVDFVAVGMFDFNIVENTIVTRNVLKATRNRKRPWIA